MDSITIGLCDLRSQYETSQLRPHVTLIFLTRNGHSPHDGRCRWDRNLCSSMTCMWMDTGSSTINVDHHDESV